MILNRNETLLMNNPVRALVQRFWEVPLLSSLGGSLRGASVLEIGCGNGWGCHLLLNYMRAREVCGVDLDPCQIKHARRRLGTGARLAVADAV